MLKKSMFVSLALGLAIAGPKSRDVLRRLVRDDVSSEAFRFMDIRPMIVGNVPTLVARVSFTGELGYEIYCAPAHQLRLFEAIEEAAVPLVAERDRLGIQLSKEDEELTGSIAEAARRLRTSS